MVDKKAVKKGVNKNVKKEDKKGKNKGKNEPTDMKLYEEIKKQVYKDIPTHSAYRSGILVQKYKDAFAKKYKGKKEPYTGKKNSKKGLKRWFEEEWVNQRGEVGYKYKSDIYRPSKRVTDKTPTTHSELSKKEVERGRREKARKGRVKQFKNAKGGASGNYDKVEKGKPKMIRKGEQFKVHGKYLHFPDYPDFKPNLTPRQMFKMGSFGGTYWRKIDSKVKKDCCENVHLQYKNWWKGIPDGSKKYNGENHLTLPFKDYDVNINKYGVKVGTTLEFWQDKGWIKEFHPYGWVHWYCDFYMGKRGPDDDRQVGRWKKLAGNNGRFMRFLVTQLIKKGSGNLKKDLADFTISPKIRQVLLHWGYEMTPQAFKYEVERRKKT